MSKDYKNIDTLFQDELGAMQAKAPAHVKENIDKAIGSKKRGLFFFLIPVLLIGIAIPTYYFATKNNAENPTDPVKDNSSEVITTPAQEEKNTANIDPENTNENLEITATDNTDSESSSNEPADSDTPAETEDKVETWTFKIDTSKLNDSLLFENLDEGDGDQHEPEF